MRHDRDLQHDLGAWGDRQKRRIGLRALLTQRRQHDFHDLFKTFENPQKRGIEPARCVAVRGRKKLVVKSELIEERTQPRIVGSGE